jgi:hypothetical protein
MPPAEDLSFGGLVAGCSWRYEQAFIQPYSFLALFIVSLTGKYLIS